MLMCKCSTPVAASQSTLEKHPYHLSYQIQLLISRKAPATPWRTAFSKNNSITLKLSLVSFLFYLQNGGEIEKKRTKIRPHGHKNYVYLQKHALNANY
jgi:hypothetical protein